MGINATDIVQIINDNNRTYFWTNTEELWKINENLTVEKIFNLDGFYQKNIEINNKNKTLLLGIFIDFFKENNKEEIPITKVSISKNESICIVKSGTLFYKKSGSDFNVKQELGKIEDALFDDNDNLYTVTLEKNKSFNEISKIVIHKFDSNFENKTIIKESLNSYLAVLQKDENGKVFYGDQLLSFSSTVVSPPHLLENTKIRNILFEGEFRKGVHHFAERFNIIDSYFGSCNSFKRNYFLLMKAGKHKEIPNIDDYIFYKDNPKITSVMYLNKDTFLIGTAGSGLLKLTFFEK